MRCAPSTGLADVLGTLRPRVLLRVDSGGGLAVGAAVLALHGVLAGWYGLPPEVVLFLGAANVAYGSFSGSILWLGGDRPALNRALVAANFAWPFVCASILAVFRTDIRALGAVGLVGEGLYVGLLAEVERRVLLR